MELGEKLYLARQEAGLSQRQLCGDTITRNMLSQIEHGSARPSMETLRYLAGRLEKPVSFFLEEDASLSPNQMLMEQVRSLWKEDKTDEVWLLLKNFRKPDPVLQWEWNCRSFLATLAAAEQALQTGKQRYARQLLEEAAEFNHGIPELERQRLLLLGRIPDIAPVEIIPALPSLDEELLLRAAAALASGNADRAAALLEAAEDRENVEWNILRGRVQIALGQYDQAVHCLKKAELADPERCLSLLEVCFRELGDYKRAYEYACKQR